MEGLRYFIIEVFKKFCIIFRMHHMQIRVNFKRALLKIYEDIVPFFVITTPTKEIHVDKK